MIDTFTIFMTECCLIPSNFHDRMLLQMMLPKGRRARDNTFMITMNFCPKFKSIGFKRQIERQRV